jgi:hypothetical protein
MSKPKPTASGDNDVHPARSLSVLLSQTLVAYTLEFDNEFGRRMLSAGHPGAMLSLVVWLNLMRFLTAGELSVRDLARHALEPENAVNFALGCLERWGFVHLRSDSTDDRPIAKRMHARTGRLRRDGWGSGRGIRSGWLVCTTEKGRKASEIWSSLCDEIERRWEARFGRDHLSSLRQALGTVLKQYDLELPHGLALHWFASYSYPKLPERRIGTQSLPVLLSQLLLAFTIEFESESRVPLHLCATTLRVLGEGPVRTGDIPRLTGASPETSDIGWPAKPYVVIEPDPVKRGQIACLSPLGVKAQRNYRELIPKIEERWQARFGKEQILRIRSGLEALFMARSGNRLLIAEGLVPAEGTIRSGTPAPALGRRDLGAAARQRMRDMVAQSEMFLRDPVNGLPHYPLWDMNRGFGP